MSNRQKFFLIAGFLVLAALIAAVSVSQYAKRRQERFISVLATPAATPEARGVYWEYPDGTPGYATRVYDVDSLSEVPEWTLAEEHELRLGGQIIQRQTIELSVTVPTTVSHGLFTELPVYYWDREFWGMAEDWCRVHWSASDGDEVFGPCLNQAEELDGPDGRSFYRIGLVRGQWCKQYFPFVAIDNRQMK